MVYQELVQDVEEKVRDFMKREHEGEEYVLEMKNQSASGENYLGEVLFVKITINNEEKKELDLVIKLAKKNEVLREKIEKAYHQELTMYEKIFPAFHQFLSENKSKIELDFLPKIYWSDHTERREALILEDLKSAGFGLHDRTKPWDLKHALVVMKTYGKYHGISMALGEKEPKLFRELANGIPNLAHDFTCDLNIREFYRKPLKECMMILKKAGRGDLVPKFDKIFVELPIIIKSEAQEGDKIVITHGDNWNNNYLFQYEDENPTRVCFIDFQLTSRNSPASDLSVMIYTNCDENCLNNFDLLLKTYHDSLSNTLEDLSCKPELFTYTKLMEHWRRYSKLAIVNVPIMLKFALAEAQDENEPKSDQNFDGVVDNLIVKNQEEYNRRIVNIFVQFAEKFL